MNQTTWKEYFSGGRKYYYNVRLLTFNQRSGKEGKVTDFSFKTETKESKWEMPPELQALMDKVGKDGPAAT